jgi:hypothetical protein|tara:strand:- start:2074 stop:2268 length:195 start_codon:yes stop_codon:yes gene_type:complete
MSLKSFVNNRIEWDAFLEELDARISLSHRNLEQASTAIEIHRAQGSILALRQLKYLRDKINGIK